MSMYTKYKTYEEVVNFLKEDAESPQCFTVNYLPDTDEYELWIGNQPYHMYDRWIEEEQEKVRDLKKEVNKLKIKLYDSVEKNKQSNKKQKTYTYHIVYHYITFEGAPGHGSTTMELKKPLESASLINEMREHIIEQEKFKNVVILNWKELKLF